MTQMIPAILYPVDSDYIYRDGMILLPVYTVVTVVTFIMDTGMLVR
jgi:hypothetical protein